MDIDRLKRAFDGKWYSKPLSLSEIESFEALHNIRLPEEYRLFLSEVANGGCGIAPLGQFDDGEGPVPWSEQNLAEVGTLSKPFPFRDAWNVPRAELDSALDRGVKRH